MRGELETEQTAAYWPPVPLTLAALLFSFCWAAQPGSWFSLPRTATWTPTNWIQLWHRLIWLFDVHLLPVGVEIAPNSTHPRSRLYLDIFDRMHLFLDWRLCRKSIYYRKSDQTDKMKRSFFQAAVVSILLYGCTTWTLNKRLEKKLDGNYTRMLWAILNKSWRQHPTRHQLYGHQPPTTKTIQARRTRHAGHCWRSKDELISDVLLWTPAYDQAKAGRPARTYIQQLCEDTGCNPEDLPEAMNDWEKWRGRVRDIRAGGTTWWWWWWWWVSCALH